MECIKTPLSKEVGLGPDDIVLDGDPASPHGKKHHSLQVQFAVYRRKQGSRRP